MPDLHSPKQVVENITDNLVIDLLGMFARGEFGLNDTTKQRCLVAFIRYGDQVARQDAELCKSEAARNEKMFKDCESVEATGHEKYLIRAGEGQRLATAILTSRGLTDG